MTDPAAPADAMPLKSCPFCGESEGVYVDSTKHAAYVRCSGCNAVHCYDTEAEAIAAWNSRDPVHEAAVERAAQAIYDELGPDGDHLAAYLSEDAAMRLSARTAEELRIEVMELCRIAARAALTAAGRKQ